jgi:hypothetical protein
MPACTLLNADCKTTIKVWDQCGGKSNCLGSDCEGVSAQHAVADKTFRVFRHELSAAAPANSSDSFVAAPVLLYQQQNCLLYV